MSNSYLESDESDKKSICKKTTEETTDNIQLINQVISLLNLMYPEGDAEIDRKIKDFRESSFQYLNKYSTDTKMIKEILEMLKLLERYRKND